MNWKNIKNWKIILAAFAGVGALFSLSMFVLGAWEKTGNSLNIVTMSSCRNEIVEEYVVPSHVDPGDRIEKKVSIKNSGNTDTLVRVKIQKVFGKEQTNGTFKENPALDPEKIILELNQNYWVEKDGYYYYREILKAGTETKEPLLSAYRLSLDAGNEYRGKDARIIVTMESIQAQEEALEQLWKISNRELKIAFHGTESQQITSVTWKGKEEGFQINEGNTDLFSNFKNLLPGCARMQKIKLNNRSSEAVEVFLRAEPVDHTDLNQEEQRLVQRLLSKYGQITVECNGKILYEGSLNGNFSGKGASMSRDITLGNVPENGSSELNVKLSLDAAMDNRFQSLTGKIKWIFSVKGADSYEKEGSIVPAKTGMETMLPYWLVLSVFFFILAIFSMHADRLEKKNEK